MGLRLLRSRDAAGRGLPGGACVGGRLMSHGDGGVVLGPPFQGGSTAARLCRLRALVHEAAIHCNDPNCPICNPWRRQSAPL
ncbi:hypothetical protein [Chromobacterium vaccinii]|uniref:hypothetical protein n=1 Tax=Chromobacterium vaccinii TaxID=1108595 RepID=UPI00131A12A2|nr:hypothetical protein [Chromobacterium vaccinii]